jgi:SAM-dependent methyltransferase
MSKHEVGVPAELFDGDYLYFYADALGSERSDAEAQAIARLLSLRPEMRVLDVPCGEGRIAGRLARLGCEVVGVDVSDPLLALAREQHPAVRFERADMRELHFEAEFDAVVNWFTSFGYFDSETNDRVLGAFARSLRAGGRLLLELHNPARLARILELTGGTTASLLVRQGNLMIDCVTYDATKGRSRTERFIVRDGRMRRIDFSLEQVAPQQLERRLLGAGFQRVELLGRDGAPYEADGPRLVALAHR